METNISPQSDSEDASSGSYSYSTTRSDEIQVARIHDHEDHDGIDMRYGSILNRLKTGSMTEGLSEEEAARRLKAYGPNKIVVKKRNPIITVLYYLISGYFGPLLWVAGILCVLAYKPFGGSAPDINNIVLAVAILIVILLQALFNFIQEFQTDSVLKAIANQVPADAQVTRDGKTRAVRVEELVVGDIVHINHGDQVPADLQMLYVDGLKINKAALDGESRPVRVTADDHAATNVAPFGVLVEEGAGTGVVIATGKDTQMGILTVLAAQDRATNSALAKEVFRFVAIIAILSITTGLTCFLIWYFYLQDKYPGFLSVSTALATCISAIVAFVPEGLPVSFVLTLTIAAKQMSKHSILVKNLAKIESIGSIDVIASDKTGTLTEGRMSVVHLWTAGDAAGHSAKDFAKTLKLKKADGADHSNITGTAVHKFATALTTHEGVAHQETRTGQVAFNSVNKFSCVGTVDVRGKHSAVLLGAAEILLASVNQIAGDKKSTVKPNPPAAMAWLAAHAGAGERVLAVAECPAGRLPTSSADDDDGAALNDAVSKAITAQALRLVGLIALADPPRGGVKDTLAACRRAGIRVAMVTGDHVTTGEAIARQVGIITARRALTLEDVAGRSLTASGEEEEEEQETGSTGTTGHDLESGYSTGTGDVPRRAVVVACDGALAQGRLFAPTEEAGTSETALWDAVLGCDEMVFARSKPEQKRRIVDELQARNKMVAVTGDGVNDAPALKKADVGVGMGGGTAVAIESATIVLKNDDFTRIPIAIEHGRLIFENLKKVLLYLLPAGSFSELLPILANFFIGLPLPLSSFLMIVICCVTDIFPSLSLVYEKAESDLMNHGPRDVRKDRLVNPSLIAQAYFFIGVTESVCAFTMYFWYMARYAGIYPWQLVNAFDKWADGYLGYTQDQLNEFLFTAQSIYFVALVVVQFGNLLATRTRHLSVFQHNPLWGPKRNLFLFASMGVSAALACIFIYIPGCNDLFRTRPVPVEFWFTPLAFSVGLFALDETRKLIWRSFPTVRRFMW